MTERAIIDCIVIGTASDEWLTSNVDVRSALILEGFGASDANTRGDHTWLKQQRYYIDSKWRDRWGVFNYAIGENTRYGAYTFSECADPAVCYLVSSLVHVGFNARGIHFLEGELEKLLHWIEQAPVCFALTTTYYLEPEPIIRIVQLLRAYSPNTPIIVGGPFIHIQSLCASRAVFFAICDVIDADYYIVEKEGESTLAHVVQALKEARQPYGIPNVLCRSAESVISQRTASWRMHSRVEEDNDINSSLINCDLFSKEEMSSVLYIRTARSCAFRCQFCDYSSRMGRLSVQSVSTVERQLRSAADRGIRDIFFVDDCFNVPEKRFLDIIEMMIANKFNFRWHCHLRSDQVRSSKTYERMRASGCESVFIGLESVDRQVLTNMQKQGNAETYRRSIEHLKDNDIYVFASFIVGFPGETWDSIAGIADFVSATQPDVWRPYLWYYYPNTPISKNASRFGLTGVYYDWKHNTMDSETARWGVEWLCGLDLPPQGVPSNWDLAYLTAKGCSKSDILEFGKLLHEGFKFNRIASVGSLPVVQGQYLAFLDKLKSFGINLSISPARYSPDFAQKVFSDAELHKRITQRLEIAATLHSAR